MFERKLFRSDMLKCALCSDAPCSTACGKLNCAALLRSIWFDDEKIYTDFPKIILFIILSKEKSLIK